MQQVREPVRGLVSRAFRLASLALLLSACAGQPDRGASGQLQPDVDTGAERESPQTPAAVAPARVEPGVRSASDSLLAQARASRAQGALDRADGLLQRAQRIDPANPDIYIELAELYAQRGLDAASRTVAQRGLLYCEGESCAVLRKLSEP